MKILLENCRIFRRFTLTLCKERNNLYFACYMLEELPEAAVWTSLKVCIAVGG